MAQPQQSNPAAKHTARQAKRLSPKLVEFPAPDAQWDEFIAEQIRQFKERLEPTLMKLAYAVREQEKEA